MDIEKRFHELLAAGDPFSADDLTQSGTLQEHHEQNSSNGRIGNLFMIHKGYGHIEAIDAVNSTSPHRHGGLIRVWKPTPDGVKYAKAARDA